MAIQFLNTVAVDTNVLYVDTSSDRVGIGTTLPGGLLHVSSGTSGDAVVIIESDTDNSNENDNPHVELRQDGGGVKAKLGIEGNAGNTYSNSVANATYLGTVFEQPLQFITGNTGGVQTAKMTIQPNTGNVGIGTTSPGTYKLNVAGTGYYSNNLTVDGFANNAGISFRNGFDPTNTGIRAKAIGTGNRDGVELLGYNGIDFTVNNGANVVMRIVGVTGSGMGNVGIGTTSPSEKLDVNGRVRIGDINYAYGGNNYHVLLAEDSNDAYISNINGNATISGGGYYYGSNLRLLNSTSTSYSGIQARADGAITFENATGGTAGSTIAVSEKMRINGSGDVGIGTTAPSGNLEVAGASPTIVIRNSSFGSGVAGIVFKTAMGASNSLSQNSSNHLNYFSTSGSALFTIQNGGNVGIGTTSPSEKLEVVGNAVLDNSNAKLKIKAGGTGTVGSIDFTFNTDSTQYGLIDLNYNSRATQGFRIKSLYPLTLDAVINQKFLISGSEKMLINSSGNVGIGTGGNVDERLHIQGSVDNDDIALKIENTFDNNSSANPPSAAVLFQTASNNGHIRVFGAPADTAANHRMDIGATASTSYLTFSPSNTEKMRISSNGDVGIGTTSPQSKLQVNGGVQLANDTASPSASKVGTFRYRTSGNNSYVDMCMQTGASTYAWVNIVTNSW